MLSQIPLELVADPLGFAEHSLGTSDFEEYIGVCFEWIHLIRIAVEL
jgi:hypothetical protein